MGDSQGMSGRSPFARSELADLDPVALAAQADRGRLGPDVQPVDAAALPGVAPQDHPLEPVVRRDGRGPIKTRLLSARPPAGYAGAMAPTEPHMPTPADPTRTADHAPADATAASVPPPETLPPEAPPPTDTFDPNRT